MTSLPTPARTLLLGGILLTLAACNGEPASEAPSSDGAPSLGPADGAGLPGMELERIQVGDQAPDFTLASYDGGRVTLSDYRGESNVLLVFYRGHW